MPTPEAMLQISMRSWSRILLVAFLSAFSAFATSEKMSPGAVNQSDPNVQPAAPSINVFSGIVDQYDYETRGRRDPFGQPVPDKPMVKGPNHGPLLPLQKFELGQLRLMAILWDVSRPQAMLKDPEGNIFIVSPNSKIGPYNGYVAAIREGEIVVVETKEQDGRLVSTAQVVKIAK